MMKNFFQAAKHTAASKALKLLRDIPLPDCKSKLDPTSQPFTPGIEYDELKSPISLGKLNIERAGNLNIHTIYNTPTTFKFDQVQTDNNIICQSQ